MSISTHDRRERIEAGHPIDALSAHFLIPKKDIYNVIRELHEKGRASRDNVIAALTEIVCEAPVLSLTAFNRLFRLDKSEALELLLFVGVETRKVERGSEIPRITFHACLRALQRAGRVSSSIVSVSKLTELTGICERNIVKELNLACVPMVLQSKHVEYRHYEVSVAEKILSNYCRNDNNNVRTFAHLIKEFEMSYIDILSVLKDIYPDRKIMLNRCVARERYEAIRHEIMKRGYKRKGR